MKYFIERKTVRRTKRKNYRIFSSRGLQLKIKLAAETFAQRQAPGAIEPAAKRRMHDELHAAAIVEETFEDEIVLRRHDAQHHLGAGQILDDLFGRRARDADVVSQILNRRFEIDLCHRWSARPAVCSWLPRQTASAYRTLDVATLMALWSCIAGVTEIDSVRHVCPQPRNRNRQLMRARRRFAQPEGNRRRLTVRIFDTHLALLDSQHSPGSVSQLKNVALQTFNGEVFIH